MNEVEKAVADHLRSSTSLGAQVVIWNLARFDSQKLIPALEHASPWVRGYSCAAVGKKRERSALPYLIRALRRDESELVRRYAAQALGELELRRAAPHLIYVLKNESDWNVRISAGNALGNIPLRRNEYDEIVGMIKFSSAITNKEFEDSNIAILTLGFIRKPDAVPVILEAYRAWPSEGRRKAAMEALLDIGERALPCLAERMAKRSAEDSPVRQFATAVLNEMINRYRTAIKLELLEKALDEALAKLQKKYRDDELVEVGFGIARLKKEIAAKKNELASHRDLILEDIPKPPPKKKGRMYQSIRHSGRIVRT